MPTLEDLGVRTSRRFNTSTTELGDIEIRSKETTELRLILPTAVAITASFSKEGLGRKLVKLFKKELQTGDVTFDDAVYISTDTPERTAKLLDNVDFRNAVGDLVGEGGPIEITGNRVTIELAGHCGGDDDPRVIRLVEILLADG